MLEPYAAIIVLVVIFMLGFCLGHIIGHRNESRIKSQLNYTEEVLERSITELESLRQIRQAPIFPKEEEPPEPSELRPEHRKFMSGIRNGNEEIQIDVTPHGLTTNREYKEE